MGYVTTLYIVLCYLQFEVDLNISFSWYSMLLPIDVRMVNVVCHYF